MSILKAWLVKDWADNATCCIVYAPSERVACFSARLNPHSPFARMPLDTRLETELLMAIDGRRKEPGVVPRDTTLGEELYWEAGLPPPGDGPHAYCHCCHRFEYEGIRDSKLRHDLCLECFQSAPDPERDG